MSTDLIVLPRWIQEVRSAPRDFDQSRRGRPPSTTIKGYRSTCGRVAWTDPLLGGGRLTASTTHRRPDLESLTPVQQKASPTPFPSAVATHGRGRGQFGAGAGRLCVLVVPLVCRCSAAALSALLPCICAVGMAVDRALGGNAAH